MNPWTKLRELMDAVPEDRRRLARFAAWRPDLGCGCVFGTLYPGTDRREGAKVNFAGAIRLGEEPEKSRQTFTHPKLVEPFTAWAHSLGLGRDDVYQLQHYNDQCPATSRHDETVWKARWRLVYAYIVRREEDHARAHPT